MLATDLVAQMGQRKLDSLAAPLGGGEWVAALYLAGSQLLVVKGTVAGPASVESLVAQRSYRAVYINLNSGSEPASKVLISDLGANGLRFRREGNEPADTVELEGRSFVFDGNWVRAGITEAAYGSAFQAADAQYARMLQALIGEARKLP